MVTTQSTSDETEAPPPPWPLVALSGLIVVMVALYLLVWATNTQADFGPRGDTMGPFAGIFSALAVLAALRSVHYQRLELRETRKEMRAQAEHLEAAATAQSDLASSQKRLADEQQEANRLTWFSELAQRRANFVALQGIIANIETARGNVPSGDPHYEQIQYGTESSLELANQSVAEELIRIRFLQERLGLNPPTTGASQ